MALPKPVRLTDGRVCLRPPELRDVPAITEACQDAEIGRWTRVPRPYRKEHARAWIEAQPEEAAVGLLGSVGLVEADLGQRTRGGCSAAPTGRSRSTYDTRSSEHHGQITPA